MIVYMATNKKNKKAYIGQTIATLEKRKSGHIASSRRGSLYPFHSAIRKYKEAGFIWEIIYLATSLEDLNNAEEIYIKEYCTQKYGYNVLAGGKNALHTLESRAKISKAMQGKKSPQFGKKHTPESRAKMSAAKKGRFAGNENPFFGKKHTLKARVKISKFHSGKKYTAERCEAMSEANKGDKNPNYNPNIYVFSHPIFGERICTMFALREEFSLDKSKASAIVNGYRKKHKGWEIIHNKTIGFRECPQIV